MLPALFKTRVVSYYILITFFIGLSKQKLCYECMLIVNVKQFSFFISSVLCLKHTRIVISWPFTEDRIKSSK